MPWTKADDNPGYHTPAWRRARTKALKTAQGRCQARMEGCQGAASQVDHILGIANDPKHQHLQAVCTSCHRKITAQQGGGYRGKGPKADPEPTPRTVW